jgi:N-acetylmuramoyl-L-alanine amidase
MDIQVEPLSYESLLPLRERAQIDLLVIHCTELPDLATARAFGERVQYPDGTGNSGHYYIDRDGSVLLYVHPSRAANHVYRYDPRSIGIELVNLGRYPDWLDTHHQAMTEPYTDAQIASLLALIALLTEQVPSLRYIAGHEDLDKRMVPASDDPSKTVHRKRDPGPMFPWERVMEAVTLERFFP